MEQRYGNSNNGRLYMSIDVYKELQKKGYNSIYDKRIYALKMKLRENNSEDRVCVVCQEWFKQKKENELECSYSCAEGG